MSTILYPHLENLSKNTVDFATQAHSRTIAHFIDADFQALQNDVCSQMQHSANIPLCEEHQAFFYHFLQDEIHPKGVYRKASSATYRAGIPDWQTLFQVADFDTILQDDVYLSAVIHCENAPHQVLLSFSSSGSDANYIIEFDLHNKNIVKNGFHLPLSKSRISWRDKDSVWVCPAWDARQCTHSGYPREVWLWRRGENFSQATPIFQAAQEVVSIDAWRYLDAQGTDIDIIVIRKDFFTHQYYLIDQHQQYCRITLPPDAEICGYLSGHFIVHLHANWQRKKQFYPSGSLLLATHRHGQIRDITILFTADCQHSIESVETSRHCIVLHYLNNIRGCLKAWSLKNSELQEIPTPAFNAYSIELIDQPWGGDLFYFLTEDLLHPPVLYAWHALNNELSVMRRQRATFNTQNCTLQQYFAPSKDGTNIPYFWCGQSAQANTPTLVYVYGGFGISQLPHHIANLGRHWLAKGNAFVIANVRGGGEFGEYWHKAAQGEQKQRSVDDVLAVVRDLHSKNKTSAAYTALQGGSNGGFIAAAAIVQAATLFSSAVIEAPLADMMRYHQLGAGASWIAEFGNPEEMPFQAALKAISPLHNIKEGVTYPPILITTDLQDDRTHPAHALKLYARWQAVNAPVYLYLSNGGHAGNSTQSAAAEAFALLIHFLKQSLSGCLK